MTNHEQQFETDDLKPRTVKFRQWQLLLAFIRQIPLTFMHFHQLSAGFDES